MVEARQFPLEHPKTWDVNSGTEAWASCCGVLIDGPCFRSLGGFDPVFFLYCEDIDLSWRIRALGRSLYFCPSAGIYHCKRLTEKGVVENSAAEAYWGIVSLAVLIHKFGSIGMLNRFVTTLARGSEEIHAKCLAKYREIAPTIKRASKKEMGMASFLSDCSPGDTRWRY